MKLLRKVASSRQGRSESSAFDERDEYDVRADGRHHIGAQLVEHA
jgi:hypothetical protein